jgi:hypothetical protein
MIACDACGYPADPQHVRQRIERLELATRFRPVHIRVLLIDTAPSVRPEDYFYRAVKDRSVRCEASRRYFDELVGCARVQRDPSFGEEAALSDFQRHGLFLAHAVECPMPNSSDLADAVSRVRPGVWKRIQLSYKPKFVALLSRGLEELIPSLQTAGWGDRLILDGGKPFAAPFLDDSAGHAMLDTGFGGRLSEELSKLFWT